MNYDDETEETVPCLEEPGTACRHVECLRRSPEFCGHRGRPEGWASGVRACLFPAGHGGLWHRNHNDEWSTCRRRPGCDCPRPRHDVHPHPCAGLGKPYENCPVPWVHGNNDDVSPHVCPKPDVLFVNFELVGQIQEFLDELKESATGELNVYDTLRLILGEMEKGYRFP